MSLTFFAPSIQYIKIQTLKGTGLGTASFSLAFKIYLVLLLYLDLGYEYLSGNLSFEGLTVVY